MALIDEVRDRWSSQFLINASNPQNSTATTEDTTRTARAVTDVQAAFQVLSGVNYDNSNPRHVLYATEGVVIRLLVLTGQAARGEWESWKDSLKEELALVEGRDRIRATTNARYKVTREESNELPRADKSVFDRYYVPRQPGAGTQDRTSSDS